MRDPYRKIITKEKISSVRFEKKKKKNQKQTKPPINQPIKKKIPTTTKKYNQQKTNREKFSPAPLDESGHGVRNAEEKEERIAVNLSELLYLFH